MKKNFVVVVTYAFKLAEPEICCVTAESPEEAEMMVAHEFLAQWVELSKKYNITLAYPDDSVTFTACELTQENLKLFQQNA